MATQLSQQRRDGQDQGRNAEFLGRVLNISRRRQAIAGEDDRHAHGEVGDDEQDGENPSTRLLREQRRDTADGSLESRAIADPEQGRADHEGGQRVCFMPMADTSKPTSNATELVLSIFKG
ncbi:hypothetical protein PQQ63_38420 [Paraburkholderia metrosideri]|uniref:Uncharacterized protein n=1 Tax=Paraburkholderia metrosideri TaxID=580937 RepID=A0ABW9E4L7_9BURK